MADTAGISFTTDEVNAQARGLVSFLTLAGAVYAKSRGQQPHDWALFIGQLATPSWSKGMNAREVAEANALNFVATNAEVVSLEGDANRAELAIRPDAETVEMFRQSGLTQEDADGVFDVLQPIAAYLDLTYTRRREGDTLHFTFAR